MMLKWQPRNPDKSEEVGKIASIEFVRPGSFGCTEISDNVANVDGFASNYRKRLTKLNDEAENPKHKFSADEAENPS
jgi:hypothetical protein